ncbi:MAG: DUF6132 family protein [Porphyromonadaceae bacterium]|jgi:uncharacterized membrane protein|nr:DUF6132 family protein [Porphyromonadaceae bacterium]
MRQVREIIKEQALTIIGSVIGAVGGYLYWNYIGCLSGTCPITSSPVMSTIWGAIIGGLLLSMFKKDKKESK